jgi:hypothetical protein
MGGAGGTRTTRRADGRGDKALCFPQLSGPVPGFGNMKTFLKVLLLAVLLILALKFSPLIFLAGVAGLVVAAVLGAVGLSLLAVLLAVALAFTLALAPIWLPVLAVVGLVKLFRRDAAVPPALPPAAAAA